MILPREYIHCKGFYSSPLSLYQGRFVTKICEFVSLVSREYEVDLVTNNFYLHQSEKNERGIGLKGYNLVTFGD